MSDINTKNTYAMAQFDKTHMPWLKQVFMWFFIHHAPTENTWHMCCHKSQAAVKDMGHIYKQCDQCFGWTCGL